MSTCKYLADPVREQHVTTEDSAYNRVATPNVPIVILRDWMSVTTENRLGVAPRGAESVVIGPTVPCTIDRLVVTHTADGPRTQFRKATIEYLGVSDGGTIRYEKLGDGRVCVQSV